MPMKRIDIYILASQAKGKAKTGIKLQEFHRILFEKKEREKHHRISISTQNKEKWSFQKNGKHKSKQEMHEEEKKKAHKHNYAPIIQGSSPTWLHYKILIEYLLLEQLQHTECIHNYILTRIFQLIIYIWHYITSIDKIKFFSHLNISQYTTFKYLMKCTNYIQWEKHNNEKNVL